MDQTRPIEIDLTRAITRIQSANRILITTHARADGDAIGSTLAAARLLRAAGKSVDVCFHEVITSRYAFLPDAAEAGVWPADPAAALAGHDLLLVLDTCSRVQLDRAAAAIEAVRIHKLAIDHHVTRDDVVDEVLLDTTAGACAQIIAQLADAAGWKIDSECATLLFTGLATDTGWYRFSNATDAVFATASRLVRAGVRPNELYEKLYLNESEVRIRLMGAIMSSFELRCGGRLAVIRVTQELLRRCGADAGMTEDIINESHRVGSVVASVMAVEPAGDEPVRMSLRSKRDANVAAVAKRFGGGGHERAAGAKIRAPFDEAVKQIVTAMEEELSRH